MICIEVLLHLKRSHAMREGGDSLIAMFWRNLARLYLGCSSQFVLSPLIVFTGHDPLQLSPFHFASFTSKSSKGRRDGPGLSKGVVGSMQAALVLYESKTTQLASHRFGLYKPRGYPLRTYCQGWMGMLKSCLLCAEMSTARGT